MEGGASRTCSIATPRRSPRLAWNAIRCSQDQREDPTRTDSDAPGEPPGGFGTAREHLRLLPCQVALVRLAPLLLRREAEQYRQPAGRAAGFPTRRGHQEGHPL